MLRSIGRRCRQALSRLPPASQSATFVDHDDRDEPDTAVVAEFCAALVQGATLDVRSILLVGGDLEAETPAGTVVISQTCDVVNLRNKPNLVVAGIVTLEGQALSEARAGRQARFAPLPWISDQTFADLHLIASIRKVRAIHYGVLNGGPPNPREQRDFALAISRNFGRFAFPDEISEWLRPLEKLVRDKYLKPTSPLAQLLHEVDELRVFSPDWNARPCEVVLQVIFAPGALPELEDEDQAPSDEMGMWLRPSEDILRTPGEIAARISRSSATPLSTVDRLHLMEGFAESLARACRPAPAALQLPGVADAVRDGLVTAEISDSNEYSLASYRESEVLDLQDLSGPRFGT